MLLNLNNMLCWVLCNDYENFLLRLWVHFIPAQEAILFTHLIQQQHDEQDSFLAANEKAQRLALSPSGCYGSYTKQPGMEMLEIFQALKV